jgi:hypothetical protein
VNVGTTVVDERLQQSITLRNNGALGTNYRLVKTSLLRNEQTPPTQVIENNKEEIKTEGSASSLEKGTSTVSGLIITKFDKLCIE